MTTDNVTWPVGGESCHTIPGEGSALGYRTNGRPTPSAGVQGADSKRASRFLKVRIHTLPAWRASFAYGSGRPAGSDTTSQERPGSRCGDPAHTGRNGACPGAV